jgi:hypothetical protein
MKRRSRYPDKVIAFALAERGRGARWKEVSEGITRQFGIKPPTERQMREWYKELGGASDPERLLKENLIKVARATIPIAAFTTQKSVIEQVPNLVQALDEGKDPQVAGGVMILSLLEQMVGSKSFDEILLEYKKQRKGDITGWMNEPGHHQTPAPGIEYHSLEECEAEERREQ